MYILESIKNFIIDVKDEIEMINAKPLTQEEKDKINSAYEWRCIGLEDNQYIINIKVK